MHSAVFACEQPVCGLSTSMCVDCGVFKQAKFYNNGRWVKLSGFNQVFQNFAQVLSSSVACLVSLFFAGFYTLSTHNTTTRTIYKKVIT